MTDIQLYKDIESLPESLKQQVSDFVAFLKEKAKQNTEKKATPQFGRLKGKVHMSDDFDEPLEDFKDYM